MVEAAGPAWTSLGLVDSGRLEKRFGVASARVFAAIASLGRGDAVMGLDKKVFRAVARASLPSDHEAPKVIALPEAEQALRAARAYERLRGAQGSVPSLPGAARGEHFLLWSSYCLRPRGSGPLGMEVLCVPRAGIEDGVLELWSRIFLASRLATLSSLRRAEVAVGLVELDEKVQARVMNLLEQQKGSPDNSDQPFPSFMRAGETACALEGSFLDVTARAWKHALRKYERRGTGTPIVLGGPGVPRVSSANFRTLVERREDELERRALELALGEPGRPGRGAPSKPRALKEARRLMRAIWDLLLRAPEAARLEAERSALSERVQARSAWMREMDLRILPDDGLKQTLEELSDLTARTAALSAQSEMLAASHGASYLVLTGLDLSVIDAGLELPTFSYLREFEEAMTRVRVDPSATSALMRGDAPESGPGQRALESFYRNNREIFGRGLDPLLPGPLFEAARAALSGPASLDAALRRAQADADRKIAVFEALHVRSVGASLSPLRAQARGLVMIREAARALEVRVSEMVLSVASDLDRRLARLEPGIEPFAAYYATFDELLATVDMTGPSLRARTMWRKADSRVARPGGAPLSASPFVGLALRRALPELLRLAYDSGPLRHAGRESDTLACSARMLGRSIVIV